MRIKIFINLFLFFILCLCLQHFTTFAIQSPFKSDFFRNSRNIQAENRNIALDDKLTYKGVNYDIISALGIIGYKTFNRNIKEIILDFRTSNSIKTTDLLDFSDSELMLLDSKLAEREQLDLITINYYKDIFSHINFSYQDGNIVHIHSLAQILKYLDYLPSDHTKLLKEVIFNSNSSGFNGYSGEGKIIIRVGYYIDDTKLRNVFYHEMGHIVDREIKGTKSTGPSLYMDFHLPIYNDDKSILFYELSKENWIFQIPRRDNFVSKYASTNPFEDFAESYALYVGNGNVFRCLSTQNKVLFLKYNTLKNIFFNNEEYYTGDSNCSNLPIDDVTNL